jgi:hypothetical protein
MNLTLNSLVDLANTKNDVIIAYRKVSKNDSQCSQLIRAQFSRNLLGTEGLKPLFGLVALHLGRSRTS